jgi:TetR/AcrR family transcriptional regulator
MPMDVRTNILACALRLFAERGYDAVPVQEIVDAAGITKPTLYHYFGSKRGLLDALLAKHFWPLHRVVTVAADYQRDLSHALRQVAEAYAWYASEYALYYRLQLALWFAPPGSEAFQAALPLNEEQQRLLEKLFVQAAEDHAVIRGRQRVYATTFLGTINVYIGLTLDGHAELSDEWIDQAVHQFMHGILA